MPYLYFDTSRGQVHARREGSGVPLLMLHNIARSQVVFENLIPLLADGFDVIAVDIPGMGRSYRPDIPFEVADVADGLREVVARVAAETGQKVAIYGHRYGATLAAEIVAGGSDDVSHVVMTDYAYIRSEEERIDWTAKASVEASGGPAGLPAIESEPDGSHLMRLWHRGYQRLFWGKGGFGPSSEPDQWDRRFINNYVIDTITAGAYGVESFAAAFRYPSRERLPLVDVPALVMHGTVGFEVPICQRSDEVAALMPDARTATIAGDAHMMYFHADELAAHIRDFVLGQSS